MDPAVTVAELLTTTESLLVVCHDNPDPDCLASALALEHIAYSVGVDDVTIVYGGTISHQQNRAMVDRLAIDVEHAAGLEPPADCIAFVDHSRAGGASAIAPSVEPDLIVDHHPGEHLGAPVMDVRTDYGSTATIMVEYLEVLRIRPTARVATALLFALHRERLDFIRRPTRREYEAALSVYPNADIEELEHLYGSAFTPATIDAIGTAITSRTRRGAVVAAGTGRTSETDALPQAAEYLLNLDGVDTVLTYGLVGEEIRLSARSIDSEVNVGERIQDAFGDLGDVGGHPDMAGGFLPANRVFEEVGRTPEEPALDAVGPHLESRFFEAVRAGEWPTT